MKAHMIYCIKGYYNAARTGSSRHFELQETPSQKVKKEEAWGRLKSRTYYRKNKRKILLRRKRYITKNKSFLKSRKLYKRQKPAWMTRRLHKPKHTKSKVIKPKVHKIVTKPKVFKPKFIKPRKPKVHAPKRT